MYASQSMNYVATELFRSWLLSGRHDRYATSYTLNVPERGPAPRCCCMKLRRDPAKLNSRADQLSTLVVL